MLRSSLVCGALVLAMASPAFALPGEHLFTSKGCVACHTLKGHPDADGTLGPDLSKLFKAKPPRDAKQLAEFIFDPQQSQPGSPMPTIGLTKGEAEALAAYVLAPRNPSARR